MSFGREKEALIPNLSATLDSGVYSAKGVIDRQMMQYEH
jgi:hypothetical protein